MSTSEDDYASSDSEAYAYDSRDEASFDESSFESYDDDTSEESIEYDEPSDHSLARSSEDEDEAEIDELDRGSVTRAFGFQVVRTLTK